MRALARLVLGHRRLVVAFWLLVLAAGIPNLERASNAFSQSFSVPGREGFQTNERILQRFGVDAGTDAVVPVVRLPAGVGAAGSRARLAAAERRLRAALPGALVAGYGSTGSEAFVSRDGRTTFIVIYPRLRPNVGFDAGVDELRIARSILRAVPVGDERWRVTGYTALQNAGDSGSGGAGVLAEALVGGLGALVVLAFVFASFLAILPLVMALFAIVATFMLMWALTTVAEVSFIVTFLVALIGLGVCIDYALLLVVRWREERANGHSNEQGVENAVATAGSAVVFSGTTVAIGLLSLVVLPVPFLRSIGYAGMLIPLVSVAVAVTLLPVVLATVGPRIDWPRLRSERDGSRLWLRWGAWTVRHRWLAALIGLAILLPLALSARDLELGTGNANTLAASGDAHDGLVMLERSGLGAGALSPFLSLASTSEAGRVAGQLAAVDGIRAAVTPPRWARGGERIVAAFPQEQTYTAAGRELFGRLKEAAAAPVGGPAGQSADFIDAVYGAFPAMIGLVAVLTVILLARAFRSLLLPVKAVVLNLLSVAAAWGVMVLVWQEGHGSQLIFGVAPTGAIVEFIPLMVFAFLFGLSMDYEVFILARTREEYDRTGSTTEAAIQGIGRTGRLVTSAALILCLSFAALGAGPEVFLKIFATGLAAGILLDATVVRCLLVPALVALFGRWNWWLPGPVARVLRVAPSAATRERPRRPLPDTA
jgi:RND superfamily putative drug exporter